MFGRHRSLNPLFLVLLLVLLAGAARAAHAEGGVFDQARAALGQKGEEKPGGVLEFALARLDLHPKEMETPVSPALTLSGYATIHDLSGGRMLGALELPVLGPEADPVMKALRQGGWVVSALHNHHLLEEPRSFYLHAEAAGPAAPLLGALREALRLAHDPQRVEAEPDRASAALDTGRLDTILGKKGHWTAGVYGIDVDRKGAFHLEGHAAPAAMGFDDEFGFQSLGNGRTALMAEYVAPPAQVGRVIDSLQRAGFTVSALHNHFLTETPRLFFIHAYATGEADRLATAAKSALDIVNR